MDTSLSQNLRRLLAAYRAATGRKASYTGRLCASDSRFFTRLADGASVTERKYGKVVEWFAENWPGDTPWPPEVAWPCAVPARHGPGPRTPRVHAVYDMLSLEEREEANDFFDRVRQCNGNFMLILALPENPMIRFMEKYGKHELPAEGSRGRHA